MKRTLIALSIAGALALGGGVALHAQGPGDHEGAAGRHGHRGMGGGGFGLQHMTKELNLTAEQQAKISPIMDQAKPQIRAIHQDAMQKTQAVMEATTAQIRPLLTPEQQQKFDRLKQAHEKMREARREMWEAKRQ